MLKIVSQNVQSKADQEGRWDTMAEILLRQEPDLLLLQECDWLADPTAAHAAAERLAMRLIVAPSRNLPVAVAWNPHALQFIDCETKYALADLHHGYCAPAFDVGLRVPLIAISTHLTPYSAAQAAQEIQLVGARAYRHGGLAFIAGDVNHVPLGDPEPDWSLVQPYNRMSRCHRRTGPDQPWRGNTIVAETLRDGDFTDVAAHVADQRGEPSLRQATGKYGRVRVDQAHVTAALKPAIVDYWRIDPADASDHYGIGFTLDLALADESLIRDYT